MSQLTDEMKSKGYWSIVIRPSSFVEKRISDYSRLLPILEATSVQLRGWDFPHIDRKAELIRGLDWVGQESEWEYFREAWRFFQTGQFADLSAIHEDWTALTPARWAPPPHLANQGPLLGVGDTLFRFSEVFEFAARLSMSEAGGEKMHIKVELHGLKGRALWVDDPGRGSFDHRYVSGMETFPFEIDIERQFLVANAREMAIQPTVELFKRFGWNASADLLKDQQRQLRSRS
jgi:hypothetical protein